MRVLLDTHVFLWWVEGDRKLPSKARSVLADPGNECFLSMASAWELAIKTGLGKLELAVPVQRYVVEHLSANGFRLLDIGIGHIGRVQSLPGHHGDPFDRLLIAQAMEEDLAIVTADPVFRKYGLVRIWS
jgi:PIN domain nuclease of toxin-antitoxin system